MSLKYRPWIYYSKISSEIPHCITYDKYFQGKIKSSSAVSGQIFSLTADHHIPRVNFLNTNDHKENAKNNGFKHSQQYLCFSSFWDKAQVKALPCFYHNITPLKCKQKKGAVLRLNLLSRNFIFDFRAENIHRIHDSMIPWHDKWSFRSKLHRSNY